MTKYFQGSHHAAKRGIISRQKKQSFRGDPVISGANGAPGGVD